MALWLSNVNPINRKNWRLPWGTVHYFAMPFPTPGCGVCMGKGPSHF